MPDEMGVMPGYAAALYLGDEGEDDVTQMTEVEIVGDVTVNAARNVAEEWTRQSRFPRRATVGRDITLEFQLSMQVNDPVFASLEAAFNGEAPVALCALSAKRIVPGARGYLGDFLITAFNRSEPVQGIMNVAVTAVITAYTDYVVIAQS